MGNVIESNKTNLHHAKPQTNLLHPISNITLSENHLKCSPKKYLNYGSNIRNRGLFINSKLKESKKDLGVDNINRFIENRKKNSSSLYSTCAKYKNVKFRFNCRTIIVVVTMFFLFEIKALDIQIITDFFSKLTAFGGFLDIND